MDVVRTEVFGYLKGAARYKWITLVVAWVISTLGWIFVSQLPDLYQANALVYVDTHLVRPDMAMRSDRSGQVGFISKLMLTRPNLEKVARMTKPDIGVKGEQNLEEWINRLQASIRIVGADRENLFTIRYEDPDASLAQNVVQAFLIIFREQIHGELWEDSDSSQPFVDRQTKAYETRLQAAEKAKEDFRRANDDLLHGQSEDLSRKLNTFEEQLAKAKTALQVTINRRDELRRQLEGANSGFREDGGWSEITSLDARIQALQSRLDELLLKYTRGHPEVVALQKSIAELDRQKRRKTVEATDSDAYTSSANTVARPNSVFQKMKKSLSEAEANAAALDSRVKTFEEKIGNLQKQMEARRKVEAQLEELTRNYEAIKIQYDELRGGQESANLSETKKQTARSIKFTIVEPPKAPTKPSGPKRVILFTVVLGTAFGIGEGMALFLSVLYPVFTTTQKLQEATELPVLGSVSMYWLPERRRQKMRRLLGFVAGFATLLLLYVGVIALEIYGYHLPTFITLGA